MNWTHVVLGIGEIVSTATISSAGVIAFEAAGPPPLSITATRDAFRTAVGGGTVAGANGDFGGVRREINWDGVPTGNSDPNPLPADFFNVTSPRRVVFSTPGTGFLVSANAGLATPPAVRIAQRSANVQCAKLFTAVNSNITDVTFFLPGTNTAATTSAFGLIFVDVEVAGGTKIDFYDAANNLVFSRSALVAGNQGLSFLGGVASAGEQFSRVRITSGANTLVSSDVLGSPTLDLVAMDDFLFAAPVTSTSSVPDSGSAQVLFALGLLALTGVKRGFGAMQL